MHRMRPCALLLKRRDAISHRRCCQLGRRILELQKKRAVDDAMQSVRMTAQARFY